MNIPIPFSKVLVDRHSSCRSSVAPDVEKIVYGSSVPVLDGEKFTIRSLVSFFFPFRLS